MIDIYAFWQAVIRQDAAAMSAFLHEHAQIRWHCSNECFTAGEFIRANCEYPGDWDGDIERVEQAGDLIITAVRVFSKQDGASFHAVSFIRTQEDQILTIDEYWGDDGPPPEWRRKKCIGTPLHP